MLIVDPVHLVQETLVLDALCLQPVLLVGLADLLVLIFHEVPRELEGLRKLDHAPIEASLLDEGCLHPSSTLQTLIGAQLVGLDIVRRQIGCWCRRRRQ